MTTPDIDSLMRSWLVAAAPPKAPPTLLEHVRRRRVEVRQRRWLAFLPIPHMPSTPVILPSAAIAAVVAALVTVSVALTVIGRPSGPGAPGGVTATIPTTVSIEFLISEDGVMSARPGTDGLGAGTFEMSGALGDEGTFTEVVSVTPEGDYRIERTLRGAHGTMVVVATARTWIEGSFPTNMSGTWHLAEGGPAYPGVVAEGSLSGVHDGRPHETWIGEVRR